MSEVRDSARRPVVAAGIGSGTGAGGSGAGWYGDGLVIIGLQKNKGAS